MKKDWKEQRSSTRHAISLYTFLVVLLLGTMLPAKAQDDTVVISFHTGTSQHYGTSIFAALYHPSFGDTLFMAVNSYYGTYYQPPFLDGNHGYEGDIVLPERITFEVEENGSPTRYQFFPSVLKNLENATSGIHSIFIPKGIISCEFRCDLSTHTITVDTANEYFSSQDGIFYNKDKSLLKSYPPAKVGDVFVVPTSVRSIDGRAFKYTKVKHVVFPQEMEALGSNGFEGSAIESVVLPERLADECVSDLFKGSALKRVEIPDAWQYLRNNFQQCKQLEYARIGSGIKYMAHITFNGDSALRVIDCMSEEPPQFIDFENNNDTVMADLLFDSITVYVPCGSGEAYRRSKWGEHFQNIVERCNSIAAPAAFELTVSPNPTSDVLHISSTAEIASLRLFDANGRLLQELPDSHQLSLANLPKGLYILQAQAPDARIATKRIVKN